MTRPAAPLAPDRADFYERNQAWPPEVAGAVAAWLRESSPGPVRAAFLGCATGVNDALPFARLAVPGDRILASDVDPDCLERLRAAGLANVEVRRVDVARDLPSLGTFDLAALFFVIHRIADWPAAAEGLRSAVAPGGLLFTSEFAGPGGLIWRSNENGGEGDDPVARLIRRYFELAPGRFAPSLRSTRIRPFLDALEPAFAPDGRRDFAWRQVLTPAELLDRIETAAYAPYVAVRPPAGLLDRLRSEFAPELGTPCEQIETIRIHRLRRA
jgi:SAM-dependent methyltransferase